MLLIITPNPSIDRTMVFADLHLGSVQRTDEVLVAAGGKGLNVARAAHTLGQAAVVCAPLGGRSGALLADLAAAEGIQGRWSQHHAGETRTCVLLVNRAGGDATALNEAGPILSGADWASFAALVVEVAAEASLCLVAGSLPRGVAASQLGALLQHLHAAGRRVIVDTSGEALQSALAARPYGIKVNASELGAVLGRRIYDVDTASAAVLHLRSMGIELAAVSLGAQGAVAADASGVCWVKAPAITVVSTVGSGDSLSAGLATGLVRGLGLHEALRLGVACGTADALTIGGGRIDLAEVSRLLSADYADFADYFLFYPKKSA
ncbi:1-phosphofructokinase family hexose kinase [Candidatus Oscillochloris fontis]|uniref:1-phosphofructokinase family hexose kinase n=1 Tax=Candidatus Oscillochloris fontis TaxID=2496868 RepID=UPI00101CD021|nr:1-phosphofructokinase family hexose kinase [Candidatus Oscillochloris fontis]